MACCNNRCGFCANAPCSCAPLKIIRESTVSPRRACVNTNGNICIYDADCRNTFWPDFSAPRCLSCNAKYCNCGR